MSLLFTILILSSNTFADHQHGKGVGAHEHGAIKLGMAVEGKTIDLDLDGPAESFIGFEYTPMTDKEKAIFSAAQTLWTKNLLTKLFLLDPKLKCSITESSFTQVIDEEETKEAQKALKKGEKKESGIHSDIEAKGKITCAVDLKGQSVTVNVKKSFLKIKKLSIDLIGSETKSIDARNSEVIKL